MPTRPLPCLAASCALMLVLTPTSRAGERSSIPHMHHALYELAETRKELKESPHDFGGHKEKALKAVDEAIQHLEKAFAGAGEKYVAKAAEKEAYRKYESHPHTHHVIHELEEAHRELKEARHDFGGHREKAMEKVHIAKKELEEAVKFAQK